MQFENVLAILKIGVVIKCVSIVTCTIIVIICQNSEFRKCLHVRRESGDPIAVYRGKEGGECYCTVVNPHSYVIMDYITFMVGIIHPQSQITFMMPISPYTGGSIRL